MPSSQDFRFRPARRDDAERLAGIESRANEFPWTSAQVRDCIASSNDCWLCLLDEAGAERVAGYAVISCVMDEGTLINLVIDPAFQGRGCGRALLCWLMERARERGVRSLFLEVRTSNTRAIRLYESCGFEAVGKRKAYYRAREGREDAIVYSAPL